MIKSEKIAEDCVSSEKLDDLLGSVLFAAVWAEFVGKFIQALEAKAVAAVKSALLSLFPVVFFQANVTPSTLFNWLV